MWIKPKIFTKIGVTAHAEKRTSTGHMDMLIATHEKKYYEIYQKTHKGQIILFGVNFSEVIPTRGYTLF